MIVVEYAVPTTPFGSVEVVIASPLPDESEAEKFVNPNSAQSVV